MNEEQYLVLIKGEDKTEQIRSLSFESSNVLVTFKNSTKVYSYSITNFSMFQKQKVTNVTEQNVVYYNDVPLPDVERVIDFGVKVRISFRKMRSKVYDANSIRIESSNIETPLAKDILEYWKEISKYVSVSKEQRESGSFLKTQFEKLNFISPNSVLGRFINNLSVRVNPKSATDTIFPFKFNLSQSEALNNALRSQVSVIEGPPGTGKTQTILNILANIVIQNKTVAVVSGNNAAVQNVQDKLELEGYGFLVSALGNTDNRKRFFNNPPIPDVSSWTDEIETDKLPSEIRDLNRRLQHLMETEIKIAQLQRELSAYRLEQRHFEEYYSRQHLDPLPKLSFWRITPQKILTFLTDYRTANLHGNTDTFFFKLKLLFRYGFVKWNSITKQGMPVILGFQRWYYDLIIGQIEQQIALLKNELEQETYDTLLHRHQKISKALFRRRLWEKYHGREFISVNHSSYKRVFVEFIRQYPILLSTTYSLRTCIPENFMFDYVIVDESSQVDVLTGMLALSCAKNVIIVGDTKQLPQIVDESIQQKIPMQEELIGGPYDYFKHNLLSSIIAQYGDTVPRVILKEHYRCHPKIIEFCNQKYYDGQLIPFTTEGENGSPLMVYHTAPGNHMNQLSQDRKGIFNQREIDVIEQEVLKQVRDYTDLGITTPFRKQVEKLASQLGEEIEVDTIHKFQGREKPIMVLSTVLDTKSSEYLRQFVNDPCMINVAVSRAQQKFIVVTHNSLFQDYGSEIGDLIKYIEYNTLGENIIESEIVSVFDLLYRDYSKKLNEFNNRIRGRSKHKSENIIWTLLDEILHDPAYKGIEFHDQVFVRNIFRDICGLEPKEKEYVNNGASVDFVLYNKLDKSPIIAIEVDGFTYHENNKLQLEKDRMKDHIFKIYGLPLLRLPTTGSGEESKIQAKLDQALDTKRVGRQTESVPDI